MERDKQKKEQDERRAAQRKERLKKQRELELQRSPGKSKFDDMNSDASEGDEDDQDEERNRPFVRKSRFDDDRRESRFDQRPGPDEPPAAEDSKSERYSINIYDPLCIITEVCVDFQMYVVLVCLK